MVADALEPSGVPVWGPTIFIVLCAVWAVMDKVVALVWALILAAAVFFGVLAEMQLSSRMDANSRAMVYGCLAVSATVLQGFGHVVYEKRSPAFSLFDFLFMTPFYLVLSCEWQVSNPNVTLAVLSETLGYKASLVQLARDKSVKWKGFERFTFGA